MPREEFTREVEKELTGEMICADFVAGAHLQDGNPKILLLSVMRLFRLLPATLRREFLQQVSEAA